MTSNYLLRQAEALLSLSRATFDLAVAGRLRALAAEFRAKAQELEDGGHIPGEFARPSPPRSTERLGPPSPAPINPPCPGPASAPVGG